MGLYRTQSGALIEADLQSESSLLTERKFVGHRLADEGQRAFAKETGTYPDGGMGRYRYAGEKGTAGWEFYTQDLRDPGWKRGPKEAIRIAVYAPGTAAGKAAVKALHSMMKHHGKARVSGSGESVEVDVPPDKAMDVGVKVWAALGKSLRATLGAPAKSEAKRPTFKAAKAAILAYLQREGWAVKSHLKVPHATSPDGELRLWFKAQAVYYSWGNSHSLNGARSLHTDIRDVTPEEFVKEADRLGRKWGKSSADDFQRRWGGMY